MYENNADNTIFRMDLEEEIKIEYYESYEEDPLSQESYSQDVRKLNEIHEDFYEADCSGNNEDNGQPYKVIVNDKLEQLPVVREQWYKAIDNSGKYVCKFCDLPYSTVQTLRRHALSKHSTEAKKLNDRNANQSNHQSINKCHICRDIFKSLLELQSHIKTNHSIELKHYCHKCQAIFDDNDSLLNHLNIYHNIVSSKVKICLTCGYKTHKTSHFNQHQKVHSQTKTHKCENCNYSTNSKPNLKIHEKIHEKTNKPYKCYFDSCKYASITASALQSHKLKHVKDKNFLYCDKCTYKTVYKQSLRKHIDSHLRNTIKATL